MARAKDFPTQRDFGLGATRPESAERDDTPLVTEALQEARNTIGLTTGSLEVRPGLVHDSDTTANFGTSVDLGSGRVYDLTIVPDGVILYNQDGSVEASFLSTTWEDLDGRYGTTDFADDDFWVLPDPDTSAILIGSQSYPTHALIIDTSGVWSFGVFQYATSLAGATLQPYWNYVRGVTIQPSGRTGTITVTASAPVFSSEWEGLRIRYLEREILLGTNVSSTVMNATVVQELPPTRDVVVSSGSGYQVGDAVEDDGLSGQGIITAISGGTITVLSTALWNGFIEGSRLVAPNAARGMSSITSVTPAPTFLWDVQMGSRLHGYPGWGAKHKGRAFLCGYPEAPTAFAVSVAGRIDDFTMGVNDGDGFVEALGSNEGGDLLYIVSAEDLLMFTTSGLYYQQTRNGEDITPQSIKPIAFSKMGCARVMPVAIDDGAVFVDAVGAQIHAALLSGDVYRSWTTRNISEYHSHLITAPKFLGATKNGSEWPENFIYAVNDDGTAAVCQWDRDNNKFGWRPWDTDGRFLAIYQAFGKTYAVVDRSQGDFTGRFRERFETGIYMDSVASLLVSPSDQMGSTGDEYFAGVTAYADHLYDLEVTSYFEGWDMGDRRINATGQMLDADGNILEFPAFDGIAQVGLPFNVVITPWDRRAIETRWGRRDVKRVVKMYFTVQDTLSFDYDGQPYGGYLTGEDTSLPPAMRSTEVGFTIIGRKAFAKRKLTIPRPGPFRLLKIRYKVTV